MLKAINCLPLLFLLPLFAFPQKATFQLYTTEDGLSRNTIWGLTQDSQGYLWVTNDGGLNRFDGQHFLNGNNSDHPVFKKIRKVGRLKVDGNYLYFWENNQVFIINTITGEEASIHIRDLVPGDYKEWFGSVIKLGNGTIATVLSNESTGKTLIAHLRGITVLSIDPMPDNAMPYLNRFTSDDLGNLFYFSNHSLWKTDAKGKLLLRLDHLPRETWELMKAGQHNKVFFLDKGKLSVLEEGAIELKLHPVSHLLDWPFIHDVIESPKGDLWLSGSENHLFFYDASTDELYDFKPKLDQLFSNQTDLRALHQDASGTIWVETVLGLLKVVPQRSLFETYYTGRYDPCNGHCSFRGFTEDEKGGVYASFYHNICKIGEDRQPPKPLAKQEGTPFELLFHNKNIFLNDGHILDLITGERSNPFKSKAYPYDIGLFEKDSQGRIWWAWGYDLFYLDESSAESYWEKVDLKQWVSYFDAMEYDPTRQWMWLGNREVLAAVNPVTFQLESLHDLEEKSFATIRYIHTDLQGRMWLGTEQGFIRFEPERNSWKKYTTGDGLPNDFVHGIQPEGDSCLWLATNHGLSRFSIETEQFINFYEEDGLPDNEFNRASSFRASNGRLYFGGMRGITAFYPSDVMEKYEHRAINSHLLLHSISMTDDEMDTVRTTYFFPKAPQLDVYYQNKTIVLEFGLMDFQNEGIVQYSYLLNGHDDTWSNPFTGNTVTFSSLPSGQYTFLVKALNAKGQWVPDELAVRLVVHPPFWATWWAYSIYALTLAVLVFAIFSVLKKRWELKNQLQNEQQEALRLKELDTFKSRLYTNLTHEFRTPLTVILGMAEEGKLEIGKLKNEALGQIPNFLISNFNLIERNGQNLLRLINQLLDLSKLEDGSFRLKLQHGDIVSFVRYVTESLKNLAKGKQLSLVFLSEIEKLETDFDPEQVQQVMMNLLSNAIKFTPAGGEVKLEIKRLDNKKLSSRPNANFPIHQFLISVSDTGIGISEKDLPHIFDRFYQVDGTTTRTGEGTGIGLAHTLELVKLMGGQIEVDSKLNKGSIFKVLLPICKKSDTPIFQKTNEPKINLPTVGDLHHVFESELKAKDTGQYLPQLLIIEDNPDLVIYLKTCLDGSYKIEVAENGLIGIERAMEKIPDLILSDVMMPKKDGFEVAKILKNDERTSHIPIVLLTAKADITSKITGLKRGADAYLSKPFHKEELLVTLSMMIENSRRMREHFSKTKLPVFKPIAPPKGAAEHVAADIVIAIQQEDAFLQKLRGILEEYYSDENFALPQLCELIGMTRFQLFRKMKAIANESPSSFIRSFRMDKAKQFLETADMNVSEVAWKVGFKDLAHFSKTFQEQYGIPPSKMKKNYQS